MPSSTRVFKADSVFGSKLSTKIDTQFVQEEAVEDISEEEMIALKVQQSQNKSQKLLKEAETEAERLIEEAKLESQKIKEDAKTNGFHEGEEKGYQQGMQEGLNEGFEKAKVENQQLKDSILLMIKETQLELAQYKEDNKQNIVLLASHMAEKIVHDQIDHTDEGILLLAKPYLYQLEKDEEFVTLTVHPSQKEKIENHKAEIENISPNTRFLIYADPTLEKKGLIIESSKAVIDLQVKKQIDIMMQEFEEMERTVDA